MKLRVLNAPKSHKCNQKWSERWYVAHTRPHGEARAAANLRQQGFGVFLPLIRKTARHARRFHSVRAPLFPRYLFVRLALGRDRWRSVNNTFGVSHLIMEGDWPKPVATVVVEGLEALADGDGLVSHRPSLCQGQQVRIVEGPLAGLVGKLMSMDDRQRARVLVEILGNPTPVAAGGQTGLVPAA